MVAVLDHALRYAAKQKVKCVGVCDGFALHVATPSMVAYKIVFLYPLKVISYRRLHGGGVCMAFTGSQETLRRCSSASTGNFPEEASIETGPF